MTAPTKVLVGPPSGITYHDPGILRPESRVSWTGEVGSVDVRWQWDTDNAFGGNTNEVVDLEYENATAGSYDLAYDGATSNTIQWDDNAAAIKTAIEGGMANVHSVTVTGTGTVADPFQVTFDDIINGGQNIPDMTVNSDSLTGDTVVLSVTTQGAAGPPVDLFNLNDATNADEQAPDQDLGLTGPWYWRVAVIDIDDGAGSWSAAQTLNYADPIDYNRYLYLLGQVGVAFHNVAEGGSIDTPKETQRITHDGTGGTFTLTYDGQGPTPAQQWNETAVNIKADLEALSNVTTVNVHKFADGDWLVEFVDVSASAIPAMTADDALLTGDTVGVVITVTVDDATPWGTGGTVGADGDPQADFNRYLFLLANVGVGFETTDRPGGGWGTGGTVGPDGNNRDDFDRYLYLNANVTTTQPCPFMFGLSKTTAEYGDTIVIEGQGLVSGDDPTDVWDHEVRLYESQSFGAAFVVMPTVTWDAGSILDTITVTVPTGSSSGFVAVVHTTTPTCTGSNFLGLTVVEVPPDADAGWWVEAWNLRNSQPILTPVFDVHSADIEMVSSDIGAGSITVPKDHPEIATMLDRTTVPPVQTLLKVYQHGRFSYGFIPREIDEEYDDDGAGLARLYGEGQESILRWGRCLWKDYPKQPSTARTWLYGSTDSAIGWGDMEPANALTNPGGEDAEIAPWVEVGNPDTSADTSEARTGTYSIKCDPNALDEGVEQDFGGRDGKDGYTDVWFKVNNIGGTYEIEVLDEDDTVLDSDTVIPGASAWATFTQFFQSPSDQTLRLRVTQTAGPLLPFWIDDNAAYTDLPTTFNETRVETQISRAEVAEGLHSLRLICDAGGNTSFNGVVGFFSVVPGQDYTLQCSVAGVTGETLRFAVRLGGVLTKVEHTLTAAAFDTISITGTAGDDESTSRFTWNSLESGAMTFFVDAFTIIPGADATNPGQIVTDVHTAMVNRLTLDFIQLGFTGLVDSKGVPWIENLSFEVNPEWTLYDLVEKFVGLGYGMEFVPVNWRGGGDTGWVLHLYNPNTIGEDWTNVASGPSIIPGNTVESATPSAAPPAATVVFGEGDAGIWSVASAAASTITALERREDFVTNRSAKDNTTLFRAVSHRLDVSVTRGAQATALLTQAGDPLPFLAFLTSDRLRGHLPQTEDFDRDILPDDTYLVATIAAKLTAGGRQQAYELDLGRYQLVAQRIRDMVMGRMLGRGTSENYQPGTGSVSAGGSSGSGATASAQTGVAGETAAHDHTWPEVQPNIAGGDLGGTFPSPSVVGIRGKPVESGAPTDGQVLAWRDADTQIVWEDNTGGGGGGGPSPFIVEADTITEVQVDVQSITTDTYHTLLDITSGGVEFLGGNVMGAVAGGLRITIDGTVTISNPDAPARGDDLDGTTFGVEHLPSIRAEDTLKIELYNTSSITREYGWRFWHRSLGGGPATGSAPAWVNHLAKRDDAAHADDDEFEGTSLDVAWTKVEPTGTLTDTVKRGVLSMGYVSQSANDASAIVRSITSIGSNYVIETTTKSFSDSSNYHMRGLLFSDGTATTSSVIWQMLFNQTMDVRSGTFTNVGTDHSSPGTALSAYITGFLYQRLEWDTTLGVRQGFSPDGITWFYGAYITAPFTPTHAGLGWSTWGGVIPRITTHDYFRANPT